MASSPPAHIENGPCYFLKLPPEIRLMIYEYVAVPEPHGHDDPDYMGKGFFVNNFVQLRSNGLRGTPKRVSITCTNRQIREESIPVLYRGLQYNLEATGDVDKQFLFGWLEALDPKVLSNITYFQVEACFTCGYGIALELSDLEEPIKKFDSRCLNCGSWPPFHELKEATQPQIDRLEIVNGVRRRMTNRELSRIIRDFIKVVKLPYTRERSDRAWSIEREERKKRQRQPCSPPCHVRRTPCT